MDKQFWKDFLSWLDRASAEQLREAAARADMQMSGTIDAEVSVDLRRMIRLIEEEMASRLLLPTDFRAVQDGHREI
ncbi:MAG: hypothetical protein D6757_05900 [Alphaproteobacteria bacterium]|nr:MAG: hypothetical protein D6757_05900 [Alphaproteobacteria bacterium]